MIDWGRILYGAALSTIIATAVLSPSPPPPSSSASPTPGNPQAGSSGSPPPSPPSPSSSTSTSIDGTDERESAAERADGKATSHGPRRHPGPTRVRVRAVVQFLAGAPPAAANGDRRPPARQPITARHQDVDPASGRIYLAHLGANRIDVLDLQTLHVVGQIDGVGSVHGVRVAPDLGRLYASATATNEVLTIDTGSLTVLARTPTGSYPDGIAYDPTDAKVYVSDETGSDETVLDTTGHPLGRIPLGGEAGNVAYDPTDRRVLVDDQTHNEIAVINPATSGPGTVERRVHLDGCQSSHGLQIDPTAGLAYVACAGNATLLVLDLGNLTPTARFTTGSNPDVLAIDDTARRLYVAAESGVVTMFAMDGHTLHKLGQEHLAAKAHTVAVDPTTHRVLFPLEDLHGKPVLRVMEPDH